MQITQHEYNQVIDGLRMQLTLQRCNNAELIEQNKLHVAALTNRVISLLARATAAEKSLTAELFKADAKKRKKK